jgi:UDP-N-acetylglucosamine 2-epimerase (non-hydrolysing)
MKKIALVVGTRPEVIKMAPVYFALKQSKVCQPVLVVTGQHREMLDQALKVFGLVPDVDLKLMQPGQSLEALTSRVLEAMGQWLRSAQPDAVLVQGDTTTVLATALAAFYQGIPVGHVEAGLRSGNVRSPFPEEMNRRLTSPLVRWHFCPTKLSQDHLIKEGIPRAQTLVTGNTVIDALLWVSAKNQTGADLLLEKSEGLKIPQAFASQYFKSANHPWILVTGHRRESFGDGFERICESLKALVDLHPQLGILYPVHLNPQVQEVVYRQLGQHPRIALIPPVNYEDFMILMAHCHLVLTDSGGVQEEAPSLGKPVLVMRENTERPEGVEAGTSILVGTDPAKIIAEVGLLLNQPEVYRQRAQLRNPYGDGQAAVRICQCLEQAW